MIVVDPEEEKKKEQEQIDQYWNGKTNHLIRYYFYVQRGLALFNEFRYLFMVIFGIYVALKMDNPVWLAIMFVVSMPVLIFAGWLSVHRISKVIDWLSVKFSTHWQMYSYSLQEEQNRLIKKIITMLGGNPDK